MIINITAEIPDKTVAVAASNRIFNDLKAASYVRRIRVARYSDDLKTITSELYTGESLPNERFLSDAAEDFLTFAHSTGV
jgi:hypothetical protein